MKKLYEKSELGFTLIIIGAYIILFSIADGISESIGIYKIITAPISFIFSVGLFVYIRKNGLTERYGLIKPREKAKVLLYYLPLLVIVSSNLWWGVSLENSFSEVLLHIISMLFIGFIEEIIFRGFLFKALLKNGVKTAVAVSSVSFGIGHIVNLLNGADFLPTLMQVCYACAAGFMFTLVFCKSESLIPCILTHSALNSLSIFCSEKDIKTQIVSALVLTVISLVYSVVILKKTTFEETVKSNI